MVTCWGGPDSWHGGGDSRGGWSQCGRDFQSWEGRNNVNGPGSQLLDLGGLGGRYSELVGDSSLSPVLFCLLYLHADQGPASMQDSHLHLLFQTHIH